MVQLHNFFFFITSMVVPCGTAAPVLFQWFVSRDVPTGAPFSNGTLIPILIPSFLLLVYLHSRKFIRSMDRVKCYVLVRVGIAFLFCMFKHLRDRSNKVGISLWLRNHYEQG